MSESPSSAHLHGGRGIPLDASVEQIVARNRESGRFGRIQTAGDGTLTVEDYAERVRQFRVVHHEMLMALARNEVEAWNALGQRLFRAAYNRLLSRGWDARQAQDRAREAAQEACLRLHQYGYPCDCPWEAWIFAILRSCISQVQRRSRSPLDHPGQVDELEDEWQFDSAAAVDPADSERLDLLRALGQLSTAERRQVLECLYFEPLTPEQTAEKMGKSVGAIYSLHSRALAELRSLLEPRRPEESPPRSSRDPPA